MDGRGARFAATARPAVQGLRASKIREVANAGLGRADILAFWFGESDQSTPAPMVETAVRTLQAGRTFYTHNQGTPALRQALAAYVGGLHGAAIDPGRVAVTSSGVSALMVAAQAVVDPGDRVVVVTPVWPNVVEIPRILGGRVETVSIEPRNGRWGLDLDRLLDALTPDTRALFLNSPNNPTGWALQPEERQVILDHCRRFGIWLIADDVYERLSFERPVAPSFLPLADPEDRLISTNSFSKAWRMTGWRLGWMVAPPALMDSLGVLLEYNTSCAPDFVQAAAVTAVTEGEPFVAALRAELLAARDQVVSGLQALPGLEVPRPDGGMYAFFRLRDGADSLALAKRLVAEAGLGLAPGIAFGPEGEGWLRWCFAARPEKNAAGLERLGEWMTAHRP
jgi:aspartate/methionine/tyrosine aminotransferase